MMLRWGSRWFLGLVVLYGVASARAQPIDRAAVDQIVQTALKAWAVPGAALVIVRDGHPVYLRGYGVRELGQPVTPNTLFPLASCSKAFTVADLALLVDGGQLGWDDPVRRHVPDFHLADPPADALVTLRDLLCHRTGVGGHDLLWYRTPWDQDESIRRMGRMPPDGPFRGLFAYNSIMFMVAGKAVARRHAGGWAGFTRERLLNPLGMSNTKLSGQEAANAPERARGHRRNSMGQIEVMAEYPQPLPNAAGSVYSTAADLGKWLMFQLGDGSANGTRLLSRANLDEMHKPQMIIPLEEPGKALFPETPLLSYALGWSVSVYRGVKVIQHSGWIDGFRVHLTMLPDQQIGFAILCNLDGTRANLAASNTLVDLLLGLPPRDWNRYFGNLDVAKEDAAEKEKNRREAERRLGLAPSLPFSEYVGEYEHPGYGVCKIRLDHGALCWEWSSFHKELRPCRGDVFELTDAKLGDPLLTFRVAGRAVTKLHVLDVDFKKIK